MKTNKFIFIILLVLVAYWVYKGYVQEVVIFNSGSDKNGSGKVNLNVNLEFKDALKYTGLGLGIATIVKACPPNTRPAVAIGFGFLGVGYSLADNYINSNSGNPSGGSGSIIISTNQGKYNGSSSSGESSKGVNKCIDGLSDVFILIKEKIMGAPINCEGSSWNPMYNILSCLINGFGFSEEQKFFIGVIMLLSVALYTSIGIMLSVLTRLIFNKPFENKYLEKIRILYSQSNNVILIVLFLMQLYGISYSIYGLTIYVKLIGAPFNEGTTWPWYHPVDKLNDLLIGFSKEQIIYILVIILLSVALFTSILIMLLVLTRLIFSKPAASEDKYLEKIRIWCNQSNNVTLISLFLMQWFGISYSIYVLCIYNGLI